MIRESIRSPSNPDKGATKLYSGVNLPFLISQTANGDELVGRAQLAIAIKLTCIIQTMSKYPHLRESLADYGIIQKSLDLVSFTISEEKENISDHSGRSYLQEIQKHALGTLHYLLHLHRGRQEVAVESGAIPILLARILAPNEPKAIRDRCIRMLSTFIRTRDWVREELWKYELLKTTDGVIGGLHLYTTSLEALLFWINQDPLRVLEAMAADKRSLLRIMKMVRASRQRSPCEAERAINVLFFMCQVPRVAQAICAELIEEKATMADMLNKSPSTLRLRVLQVLLLLPLQYVKLIPGVSRSLGKCLADQSVLVRHLASKLQTLLASV